MYSDVHRVILQACANNGCLKMKKALQILRKVIEKNENSEIEENLSEMLVKLVDEINEKIRNMDQKLIIMKHDILNEPFVVFINTMEDPINEFHSLYNVAERAYFRLLLRQISEQDEHCLRIIVAINSISNVKEKTLSKKQAENLLETWRSFGYFLIKNDLLMFGPRTIAEYGAVLKSQFPNEVKTCLQCKSVLFYGVKCGNDCETIFHRDCMKERIKRLSDCPSCKNLWKNKYPSQVFVGDTFCYFAGMTFAVVGILGHFSKTLLLFFLPQIANFLYSVPQLFHFVPCPRHRLPKYNIDTDLLNTSSTIFDKNNLGILGKFCVSFFRYFKLIKWQENEDGTITTNNFTLINLVLHVFGPVHEKILTRMILGLQIFCTLIAFSVRYPLAKYFYDT